MNRDVEHYFLGKMDRDERIAFLRELTSDKEKQETFDRYRNTEALLAFSDDVDNPLDTVRSYKRFMRRMKQRAFYRYVYRTAGYAAALVLLAMSVHFYHVYSYQHTIDISETSLFVPAGQRVSLTLSDGTTVWLNARTRLTYPTAFIGNQRRVSIEGEAFFEVAEDKDKPFIVSANGSEIKVLGTTFNVYSYPDEPVSRISLLEGSVQIHSKTSPDTEVTLRPQDEAIVQNQTQTMTIGKIPDNDYFLWREGIYSFENETLNNILKKLELYYDIKIEVKEPAILKWKYTVKFRQRDGIDEILRALCKVYPLKIRKNEEKNIVKISL
ncbi:MAG: FecR domain-containing protein [Tannerellaceae bacterium]|jgi:ferric-dicitrate binding protein FerR (iron transport regulator)|nr:FecR domain-containing protein [Tannerellaceae bacterium]